MGQINQSGHYFDLQIDATLLNPDGMRGRGRGCDDDEHRRCVIL